MAGFQLGHDGAHVLHARRAGFGLDRLDRGLGFRLVHHARQEFLDHGEFGLFLVGQFLPPAAFVHLDRFAALLGHLLQHADDQFVIGNRLAAGAFLDVAVLDLGADLAERGGAVLFAGLHRGDGGGLDIITDHYVFPVDWRIGRASNANNARSLG